MGAWDQGLFEWINHWPHAWNPFLKFFSVALSMPWVKVALGTIILGMALRGERSRKAVLLALVAVGIANTMTNIAKEAFPTNRPFNDQPRYALLKDQGFVLVQTETGTRSKVPKDFNGVFVRVGDSKSKGTASAHSANMAALAFAMCYFLRLWGIPWVAVALLTGISRIYTGVHYPSQVMLGWLCGAFAAFVVIKTWEAWSRRQDVVQSGEDEPELA